MEDTIFSLYQKTGDYFTGSHRKRPVLISLLIIFILLNFFSFKYEITVSIETLYAVFSSLVQALLALVALMGVVSIFDLQNLNNKQDKLLEESHKGQYTSQLSGEFATPETLIQAIEEYILKHKEVGAGHYIFVLKTKMEHILLSKKLVIDYAKKYTIFTFFITLISLIFLIFVPQISSLFLGPNTLYFMFIMSAYSLFLVAKGFASSISG